MAYVETYKIHFTNEQNQEVLATIYKKDGDIVDPVPEYPCSAFELSDKSEGQTKYDSTIIARELILSIWSEESDDITWETFITAEHDEWKIVVTIDSQPYFEGFITPDEGNALFQDKPYEVTIRATNGLALLKNTALVDLDGNNFSGEHSLIEYIAAALKQTGLSLPIRVRCGYFNQGMSDKGDGVGGINNDMFAQSYLDYRTFQKDPTTFVSCYDALTIILDKFCRLEYWFGYWQIKCIAELQYLPGSDYYVDYTANGSSPAGTVESENYAQIGKAVDIYPINEDQNIYSRFAIKSAKTIYNYDVWPELPKNNKFTRGTFIVGGSGNVYEQDQNGDDTATQIGTFQDYFIDDWTFGTFFAGPSAIANLPALGAGIDFPAWRRSSSNSYNIEFNREVLIEKTQNETQVLQSSVIPVYAGDKLNITFDFKLSFNFNDQLNIAAVQVYILPNSGGFPYWWRDGAGITNRWRRNGAAAEAIFVNYVDGNDKTKVYKSVSLESQPIPVDGVAYVQLLNVMDDSMPNHTYFRNFNIEYIPFVAGGYIQVDGDYWLRSQNKSFPDVAEDEVSISDSPKKVFKGALLLNNGSLTAPQWYRYAGFVLPESKHFKELLNIARFNHSYRRMYAIEGTFNGLNYSAQNNQLNKFPIGFHKRYRMVDLTNQRDFVLVPPLKMDLIKGWVSANLVEVINTANANDGTQTGDSSSFNYIFKNNV